ncbi:hypothetical protein ACFQV4_16605 [Streptomyces thermocarboxydus]
MEGAAPAGWVFKGTAHLNTVVRVPGACYPVVVRRRLPDVTRLEPHFLSEHAVLRSIEEAKVAVNAPRALALGETYANDHFAIHTYMGPEDVDRPRTTPCTAFCPTRRTDWWTSSAP